MNKNAWRGKTEWGRIECERLAVLEARERRRSWDI